MTVGKNEQDEAAGGPARRQLRLDDGSTVVASIAVRTFPRSPRQRYSYLQFKTQGKTITKYVGRVTAESKAESLSLGWKMLRARKLVESFGWSWVSKPSR